MSRVWIIDNYDSFTYNLVHYLEDLGAEVEVCRNDRIPWEKTGRFDRAVISPGPGLPRESGELMQFFKYWPEDKPLLGVCLGFQAMAEYFGGDLYNMEEIIHGQSDVVTREGPEDVIFGGVPQTFECGLYHSWAVKPEALPREFRVLARSSRGVIMAAKHRKFPWYGLQFHPESVMTHYGKKIMKNFLEFQ